MHEMMDHQIWKRRREEMQRDVELNRRPKALGVTHERRDGRSSALAWEIKRQAGRLIKLLGTLGNTG